jgi:hypothetical protein
MLKDPFKIIIYSKKTKTYSYQPQVANLSSKYSNKLVFSNIFVFFITIRQTKKCERLL